jgi:Putative prokaryotic signal transducing protein
MSWKVCHATVFEPEAYLVKGFLEHQGIPCLLENGRFGMDPVRIGSLGTIRILVPEEWVPVASKLISRRTRAAGPPLTERRVAQVITVDFARRRRRVRTSRRTRSEVP